MARVIKVNGGDPSRALEALDAVLVEINQRSARIAAGEINGRIGVPDLYLTVNNTPQLLADPTCRSALRRVLALGRKVGLVGVSHDGGNTIADSGGCAALRDLLAVSSTLTTDHTRADAASMNATAAHH